jgi:hypothetical protein
MRHLIIIALLANAAPVFAGPGHGEPNNATHKIRHNWDKVQKTDEDLCVDHGRSDRRNPDSNNGKGNDPDADDAWIDEYCDNGL